MKSVVYIINVTSDAEGQLELLFFLVFFNIYTVLFLSGSIFLFHFCMYSTVHCGTGLSRVFLLTKNFG